MRKLYELAHQVLLACLLIGLWHGPTEAQPWKLLNPDTQSPTGQTIDVHIPEKKNYPSDPIASDLDTQVLRNKLGNDFASSYVAVTKDEVQERKKNENPENDFLRKMLVSSMPEEIKHLDFKMPGMGRHLGPRASKKLQLWLWQISHCSVLHKWKDLGVRYWPRYVNVGRCSKKATCSFPSGMRCRVSKQKQVALLRWRCKDINKARQKTTCQWLKFHYPVVKECKCACQK